MNNRKAHDYALQMATSVKRTSTAVEKMLKHQEEIRKLVRSTSIVHALREVSPVMKYMEEQRKLRESLAPFSNIFHAIRENRRSFEGVERTVSAAGYFNHIPKHISASLEVAAAFAKRTEIERRILDAAQVSGVQFAKISAGVVKNMEFEVGPRQIRYDISKQINSLPFDEKLRAYKPKKTIGF